MALAAGPAPRVAGAPPLTMNARGVPVGDAQARGTEQGAGLALSGLGMALLQIMANVEGASSRAGVEPVHQMRVGFRRLRAANALARSQGLSGFTEGLEAEIRWASKLLAAARDWDVIERETWPAACHDAADARRCAGVPARIAADATRRHRALDRALHGARFRHLALDLLWAVAQQRSECSALPAPRRIASVARATLGWRHAKLARAIRHAAQLAPEDRHRLRIDARKLRYLAELFAGHYPKRPVARYLRSLADLQTALGRQNDLRMSTRRLDRALRECEGAIRTRVAGILERHAAATASDLEKGLRRACARFERVSPFWA